MFKFLKDKISKWAKKISQKTEPVETSTKEIAKANTNPRSDLHIEKPVETKKEPAEVRELHMPMKFNAGAQKYEPDLDKLNQEKQGFFKKIT